MQGKAESFSLTTLTVKNQEELKDLTTIICIMYSLSSIMKMIRFNSSFIVRKTIGKLFNSIYRTFEDYHMILILHKDLVDKLSIG